MRWVFRMYQALERIDMTITLTREEAQQILDALGSCEEDWIYDGEDEHPVDVYDKEKVGKAFALLKNRLEYPQPVQVLPHEFVATVTGKEHLRGIPVMMSVWPTGEDA